MADIIKLLPDHIANQIAAGEVVQRPASVVKELMENAIDAGGKNIKLIIKDAGKTLIQIIDDGIGMSETDARMSFERHATSKIKTAEEIFSIRTMGFRGEALASIAAVAQVELKTKQHGRELGTQIIIHGSEIISQEPCQAVAGTSISVKNLFYNIPARRNFLKADNVEMRHIVDEFQQIAMAHPNIFFSLHHNGEKVYHLPPGNQRQRIVGIFGQKSNHALIPISEETDILKISGFIGKPEFAKKMRGEQLFFVNNRYIKSNYLHHALMLAYEDLLPEKMYPLYVVFFEMDPALIDVNVHPTKQEIKFENERLVYNYLRVAARHGLAQHSITPSIDFEVDHNFGYINDELHSKENKIEQSDNRFESKLSDVMGKSDITFNSGSFIKSKSSLEKSNLENWEKLYEGLLEGHQKGENPEKISFESEMSEVVAQGVNNSEEFVPKQLYQLHNSFIISPLKTGFILIDQAAAHQRILFEQYIKNLEMNEPIVQTQLFPQTIELAPSQSELLSGILSELNNLGIDIREFGKNTFVVNGLPVEMKEFNEQMLIEELLENYQNGLSLKLEVRNNIARSLAKQTSIKQGKVLNQQEMQRIADMLFACEHPFTTPNGKKTFIKFEMDDILKKFD